MRRRRLASGAVLISLCLAATSCTAGGTAAEKLHSWESGAGYSANQTLLATDLSEISAGIHRDQIGALHTACDGLAVDAGIAYGNLPTPDRALTGDLNDEYLDLTRAAEDCSHAQSARALAAGGFAGELRRALAARAAAGRRIAAIG